MRTKATTPDRDLPTVSRTLCVQSWPVGGTWQFVACIITTI